MDWTTLIGKFEKCIWFLYGFSILLSNDLRFYGRGTVLVLGQGPLFEVSFRSTGKELARGTSP